MVHSPSSIFQVLEHMHDTIWLCILILSDVVQFNLGGRVEIYNDMVMTYIVGEGTKRHPFSQRIAQMFLFVYLLHSHSHPLAVIGPSKRNNL